jgi:hypothetical protein
MSARAPNCRIQPPQRAHLSRPPILPCLQAVASALLPKLEKTRSEVEELLFEVVTLEVGAACFSPLSCACWFYFLLLAEPAAAFFRAGSASCGRHEARWQ